MTVMLINKLRVFSYILVHFSLPFTKPTTYEFRNWSNCTSRDDHLYTFFTFISNTHILICYQSETIAR